MRKRIIYIAALLFLLPLPLSRAQTRLGLTLEQCKDLSEKNDTDLKNAALDISSAKALRQEAVSEFFPKLSLNALGFYALDEPLLKIGLKDVLGNSDGAQNLIDQIESAAPLYGINTVASFLDYGYNASALLTQPIYAGGRIVNGNRLAKLNLQASRLKAASVARDKKVEVEEKYWAVVSLEEKLLTVNQALNTMDTLFRDVRNACLAGFALDTDTLKVSLERKRLQADRTKLLSGIRLSKMDLFNAIGQKYSYFASAANESAPWIDDIALLDRPAQMQAPENYYVDGELAALRSEESHLLALNVESARLQKKMAIGEALPQLGVGVGYGYGRFVGDRGRWNGSVFAMVKIPLTDYVKASAKAKRMENDAQKAENQQEYLNGQLVLQMHKLWEDLNCSYEKIGIAADEVALGELAESRMLARYLSGQATIAELLTARTDLRLAQDKLTEARIEYAKTLSSYLSKSRTGN